MFLLPSSIEGRTDACNRWMIRRGALSSEEETQHRRESDPHDGSPIQHRRESDQHDGNLIQKRDEIEKCFSITFRHAMFLLTIID